MCLYGNYEVLLPVSSYLRAEESWRKRLFSRVSKKIMDLNKSERSCWCPLTNPATQINRCHSPVCQASSRGHGHRTSKAACHPVGCLPLHHLILTRQDLGCEGPLCTHSSRQPGLPPELSQQPGAWIPERLFPLHLGQPCSRSHAPDTDPSGLDDPSATPRTQGLTTVGTVWEILSKEPS